MKLLAVNNDAKTRKGTGEGVLTGVLYLAPAKSSGVINVCPFATPGCIAGCLNTAGRGSMDSVQRGRVRKTLLFVHDRREFFRQLGSDIRALVRKAEREGLKPAVRLNGTSDLPWHRMRIPGTGETIIDRFPGVQFYDYTKAPRANPAPRPNYDITFSLAETAENRRAASRFLGLGGRVAAVFASKALAATSTIARALAADVTIDGDAHDIRFREPGRALVALVAKGRAKKDDSGFVIRA